MAFGPAERTKQRVMIDLAATLARLLTRKGNRVGAMLYNGRSGRTIPPLGGQKQVLRLIRELGKPTVDLPSAKRISNPCSRPATTRSSAARWCF